MTETTVIVGAYVDRDLACRDCIDAHPPYLTEDVRIVLSTDKHEGVCAFCGKEIK